MKRKDFLTGSGILALAAGGFFRPAKGAGRRQTAPDREAEMKKFRETWLATLMSNLEAQFDVKTRTAFMESCGRACARRSSVFGVAASSKGDPVKLVQTLAKFLGKDNAVLEGKVVRLTYPKCYCEMVADGPARLPDVYCCCSQGWIKEMFETAAGKPVKVQTLQTVKRGADSCKFVITL
jgi:predicted hydrocarbon binding protein